MSKIYVCSYCKIILCKIYIFYVAKYIGVKYTYVPIAKKLRRNFFYLFILQKYICKIAKASWPTAHAAVNYLN